MPAASQPTHCTRSCPCSQLPPRPAPPAGQTMQPKASLTRTRHIQLVALATVGQRVGEALAAQHAGRHKQDSGLHLAGVQAVHERGRKGRRLFPSTGQRHQTAAVAPAAAVAAAAAAAAPIG